ncbi:carbon-nitrogen family hydrolase [Gracilibacillus oryzae]|uniref:Carbon-nitrogen family hydrolase n=1 Tax=Gracilibacillus oryzae TaxID=1672701 RepID=A0A7C8GRE1_9BACI|nr:carbon-nitrogen family hydrolase [Gracilibacillus oryzae]KAB8128322.1 carbon-nitrogen family hydrolase [Gracilibacillus oryzae]
MKHAIFQMDVIVANPEHNRQKIFDWVQYVTKDNDLDTIVLPEMWNAGYKLDKLEEIADNNGAETIPFLSNIAKEYSINIIGGSIANRKEDGIYNSSYVFNRKGELVYQYDKIHLVPMLNEPVYLQGGKEKAKIFHIDGIKMGLIICYDLRFPEITRSLALQGAEVIYVVAQWPASRAEHWKYLQYARAIENQCYIISANSSGTCDETQFAGESLVIEPTGKIVTQGPPETEAKLYGTIHLERVTETRKAIPVFTSRVPHLYDGW